LGAPIVSNIVMLGALVGTDLLPGTMEQYQDMLRETLPARSIDLNLEALERGQRAVRGGVAA
jgi:Pyruvate/2-oxoacid:ferredoxin oxidoreductase gamma subunit